MTFGRNRGVSLLMGLVLLLAACGGNDSDDVQPEPDDGNGNGETDMPTESDADGESPNGPAGNEEVRIEVDGQTFVATDLESCVISEDIIGIMGSEGEGAEMVQISATGSKAGGQWGVQVDVSVGGERLYRTLSLSSDDTIIDGASIDAAADFQAFEPGEDVPREAGLDGRLIANCG